MNHSLWQTILGEIELSVSRAHFRAFWKETQLLECSDETVIIGVKNVFVKGQIEGKFDHLVRDLLYKNGVSPAHVLYKVILGESGKKRQSRQSTLRTEPKTHTSTPVAASPSPSTLNPRHTFETFVVGSSNDLAYAACQAVAKSPGEKYNPVFIYGGVGLGKTHLIQAVGNEIAHNTPAANIVYVNTETFVNEFLHYVRYKKQGFSDRYRSADVLIIDDIQFIAGKEKTQEEFFHTFNTLHQANKQIIISADKPPKSIPTLTERLRSRFEWGMSIDIQLPDIETRAAIIASKAEGAGFPLKPDVVTFLAEHFKTNIRELEGTLNQLFAMCEMQGLTPDIETAEAIIGDVRKSRPHHITAKQIIDRTATHFQIDVSEIKSPRRDKHIAQSRQIAMYLLRSELHMSFPRIAEELGRKDHTTAMHSVEKITKAVKLDTLIREQIADIRDKLYA